MTNWKWLHIQNCLCKRYKKFLVITRAISHNLQAKEKWKNIWEKPLLFGLFFYCLQESYFFLFHRNKSFCNRNSSWNLIQVLWILCVRMSVLLAIGEMQIKLNESLVTALQSPLHPSLECHALGYISMYRWQRNIQLTKKLSNFRKFHGEMNFCEALDNKKRAIW